MDSIYFIETLIENIVQQSPSPDTADENAGKTDGDGLSLFCIANTVIPETAFPVVDYGITTQLLILVISSCFISGSIHTVEPRN